jgi:putative pyruvate formate lyase activating enzyme
MTASYIELLRSGELSSRVEKLKSLYSNCVLCPWECRVDRTSGRMGVCTSKAQARVSSYVPHFGEEPYISGEKGSGTIFFSNCNLTCIFCQNWQISQEGIGNDVEDDVLAEQMLHLQSKGCHNINLVSPTHFIPSIVSALYIAAQKGLNIPIVYNTNGYEKVEILKLLDGVIDIYLPDIKYSDNLTAIHYSNAPKYMEYNHGAIKEMFRQVGNLQFDNKNIATRGLLIRHLVLPASLAGSKEAFQFLATEISKDVHIAIMSQYKPCYKALENKILNKPLTGEEYHNVLLLAEKEGLHNILAQELDSAEVFLPDFKRTDPFK